MADRLQRPTNGIAVVASVSQVEIAGDHSQEIVEIMCNPAGQLSDRLEPLGLHERRFDLLTLCDFMLQLLCRVREPLQRNALLLAASARTKP